MLNFNQKYVLVLSVGGLRGDGGGDHPPCYSAIGDMSTDAVFSIATVFSSSTFSLLERWCWCGVLLFFL